MAQVDYFLSPISPNVYLAGTRAEEIAARHGARIVYRPVDVGGLFARTGGTPLPERHESRKAYRLQELRRQSAKRGLPLTPQPAHYPANPAPASYAIIAAQAAADEGARGDVGALVHGLARACWAEERDIAADDVVRDCLSAAGFDPALADSGLLAGAEAYATNLDEAVARGVFGVPFWIVAEDDERFWGQDRLDDLEAHLASRG